MRVRQCWTGYREIISKSFKLTTAISTACVRDPHAETRCVKCRLLSESHTRRHKCVKYRLLRSTGGSSNCVPLIEVRIALANLGPQCNRVTSCNQITGPGEDQVEVRTALANLSFKKKSNSSTSKQSEELTSLVKDLSTYEHPLMTSPVKDLS